MPCPLQLATQSAHSIGPIEDEELICRGALDETHGNMGTCLVRNSIIEKKALAEGHLSVFRALGNTTWELDDVAIQLKDMNLLKPVFKVIGVRASDLRATTVNGVRVCVVDETESNAAGDHHPLHGHITPCRNHVPMDRSTDLFDQLRLGIWTLFQHAPEEQQLVIAQH